MVTAPIADAGPAGTGDFALSYLGKAGDGFYPQTGDWQTGAGFNAFIGDLDAAGAGSLEFDARFVYGSALTLRVLLQDTAPALKANWMASISNTTVSLSDADTAWHHYKISITAEDMTVVQNTDPRTHVNVLGLKSDVNGVGPGASGQDRMATNTLVYFDNIVLTPEPTTGVLFALGAASALLRRRRS